MLGSRPSVLIVVASDWSYPHAGAYGDWRARTPHFDRLAREGMAFSSAFAASPVPGPSRAALLTGQHPHRLDQAVNQGGALPAQHGTYPDLIEPTGYAVGFAGLGWGPGPHGGRKRNPAGQPYPAFEAFLQALPQGKSYAFWHGWDEPATSDAVEQPVTREKTWGKLPPYWIDTEETYQDLNTYRARVERFDQQLGQLLGALDRSGRASSTMVVVTADVGMPLPRGKANLYDLGSRVPLVVRWPGVVTPGRTSQAVVGLLDLAPTFLEAAGAAVPATMNGRSLLPLLQGKPGAERGRDQVFLERERHAAGAGGAGYPSRALRTREFLYVRNLRPDRWPAGDPQAFADCDPSATKDMVIGHREAEGYDLPFRLSMDKRPAEELYDVRKDPLQVTNLAGKPAYAAPMRRLRGELERWMKETADPRVNPGDDRIEQLPAEPAAH